RPDRVLVQHLLPARQALALPVAVGTAHVDHAMARDLVEDRVDLRCRCVVCVDQQGDAFFTFGHVRVFPGDWPQGSAGPPQSYGLQPTRQGHGGCATIGTSRIARRRTDMPTQLEQLRSLSTVVADTGDIEAIARFKPMDATTNPSLLFKAASLPAYASHLEQAVAAASGSGEAKVADAGDRLSVAIG